MKYRPGRRTSTFFVSISCGLLVLFLCTGLSCAFDAYVRHVIDGDTIVLKSGERVRYKKINAPEIAHKDSLGEPFGLEAKRRNQELVGGKVVRLVVEHGYARDRFGRLLADVYLAGDIWVEYILVSEGLATVCAYNDSGPPEGRLLDAQRRAIDARIGMWSVSAARPEPYYTGSSASMRFHRPSCPFGRETSRSRTMIFKSREAAFKAGYCPCRDCLP